MFAQSQPTPPPPAGGRLIAADGRALPLRGVHVEAHACGGRARVVLTQTFTNPHLEPLHVTYQVPLPADAAVAGYAFVLGDTRIEGRVETRAQARATFEEAVIEGRSAALLEQDRSSLFTQQLGNVPPGATVTAELTLDQPLQWEDAGWTWRFPTVVAPRYMNGTTPDPDRVSVDVLDGPVGARAALALTIRDARTGAPASPSHALHLAGDTVTLADAAALDRDIVVRWPVAAPTPGLTLDVGRRGDRGFGALTIVPPALPPHERGDAAHDRDLCLLLDVSGSMGGEPLEQARRVCHALIDALGPNDQLEMVAFAWNVTRWRSAPVKATPAEKAAAHRWLDGLRASGGTEMKTGILEALDPLRPRALRQVLLVSDGLIGSEADIVGAIQARLPAGCRLHVLGVGHGVNRSLTAPAARVGRGVEAIVAPGEDAEKAVARVLARTSAPLLTNLRVSGSAVRGVAQARLPDVYAGSPAQIAVEVDVAGGEIVVEADTPAGPWRVVCEAPAQRDAGAAAVPALFAHEQVEDLEARAAVEGQRAVDGAIEALGLAFQIATRRTSWVAVSAQATVDPRAAARRETMPHAMTAGLSAEGLGLRAAAAPSTLTGGGGPLLQSSAIAPAPMAPPAMAPGAPPPPPARGRAAPSRDQAKKKSAKGGFLGRLFGGRGDDAEADSGAPEPAPAKAREAAAEAKAEGAPAPTARPAPTTGAPAPQAPASMDAFEDADDQALDELEEAPVDSEAEVEDAPAAPAPRRLGLALRRLMARVRLRDTRRLVVEAELDAPAAWDAPAEVTLTLADGARLTVRVDRDRSTADASLPGGVTVRLTLDLTGDLPADPVSLTFADHDWTITA